MYCNPDCNSINHLQINTTTWGLGIPGWGTTPKEFKLALQYASHLAKFWPNSRCDYPYPLSDLIENSIPSFKQGLAIHSWQDESSYPRKCLILGCRLCVTQTVLLKGVFLKHTLYIQCISLYISLFQIRKYSYIAYDNLF